MIQLESKHEIMPRIIASAKNWIEDEARRQIEKTAGLAEAK